MLASLARGLFGEEKKHTTTPREKEEEEEEKEKQKQKEALKGALEEAEYQLCWYTSYARELERNCSASREAHKKDVAWYESRIADNEEQIARLKSGRAGKNGQRHAQEDSGKLPWVVKELQRIIAAVHPDRHPRGVPNDLVCKEINALRTKLKGMK